jgi:hypothetical protein
MQPLVLLPKSPSLLPALYMSKQNRDWLQLQFPVVYNLVVLIKQEG